MTGKDPIEALRRNDAEGRYEAELADGGLAVLDVSVEGDRMLFLHTETPVEHRGQGIAGRLTRFALDDAVSRGLAVVPYCPFTAWFIGRNPEYREHVASGR